MKILLLFQKSLESILHQLFTRATPRKDAVDWGHKYSQSIRNGTNQLVFGTKPMDVNFYKLHIQPKVF